MVWEGLNSGFNVQEYKQSLRESVKLKNLKVGIDLNLALKEEELQKLKEDDNVNEIKLRNMEKDVKKLKRKAGILKEKYEIIAEKLQNYESQFFT
ncbi:MAG: hypothetical protein ABIH00_09890 [Armatimonadota bacterium]